MSFLSRVVTGSDGSPVYVCADGDTVDAIAHAFYGKHARNTEAILEHNPGLAAKGALLSAGTVVKLPEAPSEEEPQEFISLWD